MVKTPPFHCRGCEFKSSSGETKIPPAAQHSQRKGTGQWAFQWIQEIQGSITEIPDLKELLV